MVLRIVVFALCFFAGSAIAQDGWIDIEDRLTAEERTAAGLDTLSPEQLATLNRLLREDAAGRDAEQRRQLDAARADAETARAEAARATEQAAIAQETRDAEALAADARENDLTMRPGYSEGPSSANVVGTVSGWQPGDEFRLDNGQVWKVLKGEMELGRTLANPPVRLVPGWAGRWFLEVDPDLPKARVYRID